MLFLNILAGTSFKVVDILIFLALILGLSKLLGLGAKKIGLPQVVALLLTGLILGGLRFIPGVSENFLTDSGVSGVKFVAEIGVVLILFSAGLGTDLKQVKQTGLSATVITVLDVVLSMALGFFVVAAFNKFDFAGTTEISEGVVVDNVWSWLFYGTILTATSVSVTVQTLKELGKLNSKIGTTIVSAAILDDIIGVIILSVVLSIAKKGDGGSVDLFNGNGILVNAFSGLGVFGVILSTILFFVFVLALGYGVKRIFKRMEKRRPHHRRIPIYSLAFCFLIAYLSEWVFGIADITGAFFAGLILANMSSTQYIERRTDIISYILFTPVFFAKIGLTTLEDIEFTKEYAQGFVQFFGIGMCLVLVAFLGKFIGASVGSRVTKNTTKDSIRCGLAMTVRAEVCLVSASKGIDAGLVDPKIQLFLIILIIATSFGVPLLLKASYKKEIEEERSKNAAASLRVTPVSELDMSYIDREESIENLMNYSEGCYSDSPLISETSMGDDDYTDDIY
ncbi:MAG: cation:proton antiporter [Acholeplasmatales bacterium]|nr:cation:proton antiporter [Acholeplasmatales bacterium]